MSSPDLAALAPMQYYGHLMELLKNSPELRNTASGIFKQMISGTTGAFAGGFLGGPLGGMVGGVVGSAIGYRLVHDYDSLVTIYENLTDEEREALVSRVQALVGSTTEEDLTVFTEDKTKRAALIELLRTSVKEITKEEDTSIVPSATCSVQEVKNGKVKVDTPSIALPVSSSKRDDESNDAMDEEAGEEDEEEDAEEEEDDEEQREEEEDEENDP